jgi:putative RecB family exonuclease
MSNGITAWSYSRYADYKQCPLRFKLKYIDKLQEPGSPAMQRGGDIHKEGEDWLKAKRKRRLPVSYQHFADEMAQLRELDPLVEQQWGFTRDWAPTGWFGKDTWLRIICDVAVVYEDGDADVIDFKTGRKYDTNEEQVELFSTGIFNKFPDVNKVTTRLWYLDLPDDNEVIREYTRPEVKLIMKDWEKKIIPMFKDKRFAPTPNNKCRWCAFSKDKGGPCPYNGG